MKTRPYIISLLWPLISNVYAQKIYLHPSNPSLQPKFSLNQANLVLLHHLRLDQFESLTDPLVVQYVEKSRSKFVGSGRDNALVVSVLSDSTSSEFIPDEFRDPLEVSLGPTTPSRFSFAPTLSRCASHGSMVFGSSRTTSSSTHQDSPNFLDSLHLSSSPDVAVFMNELSSMSEFLEESSSTSPSFGTFEFSSLDAIRSIFGEDSEGYTSAIRGLRAALQSAATSSNVRTAVLVGPAPALHHTKRQPQQPLPIPPQEPFFSTSTCFTSLTSCTNSTNSCSGHGTCINATRVAAGKEKTCFVCACSPTTTAGSTQVWVGTACERKDISTQFALFTGTSVALLLLVAGSISLLYSIGSQELPGTLTAIPSSGHRKD